MSEKHDSGSGRSGVSRRDVLRGGVCGAAGLLLGNGLSRPAVAAPPKAKAKAVIQVWLWGGPPHLDTFDPKPDAGDDYTGPLKEVIPTNVDGIKVNAAIPLLAEQADKYSIIRSMTHGNNGHETAAYMVQTARKPGGRVVYPSIGAVVSLFKGYKAGYKGLIPPYVVLTQPQGRFSEAGFLGSLYKPFATGGNPASPVFVVEGIALPGVSRERQEHRRDLLHRLDALRSAIKGNPQIEALGKSEEEAYSLILGEAGKVFDLSDEDEDLRKQYGPNTFGQSCLVARRLVERGIPYVTINYGGWDTHKENFKVMRTKLPQMDTAFSTLLQDLKDRGLLDSTIVWWSGEFGRTPKVAWESPWNGGRHHHGACFTAVVAGGGFKGGHVVGESDAKGEQVRDRPVYPWDLLGSIYELLGIDPDATLPHPQNLTVHVTPRAEEGYKMGGRLKEIM
jgi:hypothetical protein